MRSHIIVLPGGGYANHAAHEGEPVARWLEGLGLEASVFLYPVHTLHPGPLDAIRAEIRAARAAGAERVALVGFSAGGHAAGHAALAAGAAEDERVDAVILGYPVVSMQLDSHAGSRVNLLGADESAELRETMSLDRLVSAAAQRASAPPFFIWHTADDAAVPVEHTYLLGSALAASSVAHSLHVFPHGAHGLGLATGATDAPHRWPDLAADWLRDLGWI